MGRWGNLPWDSDTAHSFTSSILRETAARVSAEIRSAAGRSSCEIVGTEEAASRFFVSCELLVRLGPYYEIAVAHEGFDEDVRFATDVLERLLPYLYDAAIDEEYAGRILRALRTYTVTPVPLGGVPAPRVRDAGVVEDET